MPIPKPQPGQKEDEFIGTCMEAIGGEYDDKDQALAVCYATWKESKKKEMNDELLEAIQARQQKATEFGYGILTADCYVKNVLDAVGLDKCYRFAATRSTSWNDVMQKAARTLVYSNPDMEVESVEYSKRAGSALKTWDDFELPKNTLMVFRHTLTTPRKDRDGDVLRTQGASVDPKMLLLWQHVHTLPIGKMLTVADHNNKRLSLISCIVDVNELCHDSAVMIDNGMGRFSHGFRALEFSKIKARDGEEAGFDVSSFEIMEASLVSVPSNVDAEVEEVMLSLVEGGKLKSPIMKAYGKSIRDRQPTRISLPVDLVVTVNGKEISHEELIEGKAQDGETGSSTKADDKAGKEEGATTDEEMKCPECGAMMPKGAKECPECGYDMTGGEDEEEPEEEKAVGRKYGRTLSSKSLGVLKEVHDDLYEMDKGDHILSMQGRGICEKCRKKLKSFIDEYDTPDAEEGKSVTVEEAMAIVLADASPIQRNTMRKAFDAIEHVERQNTKARQYRAAVGS